MRAGNKDPLRHVLGRESAFASHLESVRAAHKPKRNFLKLLEGAKWE